MGLATDVAATFLVLLAVEAAYPLFERILSSPAAGFLPWAGAVLAFLAVRLVVWGLYEGMRLVVERVAVPPKPSSRGPA